MTASTDSRRLNPRRIRALANGRDIVSCAELYRRVERSARLRAALDREGARMPGYTQFWQQAWSTRVSEGRPAKWWGPVGRAIAQTLRCRLSEITTDTTNTKTPK